MKNLKLIRLMNLLSIMIVMTFITCSKDDNSDKLALNTSSITELTASSAKSGGNIKSDGGSPVTARGVCWNTQPGPSLAGNKTTDGAGIGNFTSLMSNLRTNTTYYVRAYATTGIDTAYGNEISFKTIDDGSINDFEGNRYQTKTIGTQVWMVENLKSTKFNDGSEIPLIVDDDEWKNMTGPGFSWYNNDMESYKDPYGGLYNFHAVNTGKLCPIGWHVPSQEEWGVLINACGGAPVAGGALKEKGTQHWEAPNTLGTNSSGFAALPGGSRNPVNGFGRLGMYGEYFTSTLDPLYGNRLLDLQIEYDTPAVSLWAQEPNTGFSVRCIKNQ